MRIRFSLAVLAVLFATIVCGGVAHAQQTPDSQQSKPQTQQPPDSQEPSQSPQQPSQAQSGQSDDSAASSNGAGQKEFVGTVVKQGDKYILQDSATGTMYDIDHQDEVKKFEGKKVRVHGTMDPNGKMIHVQ